MPPKNKMNASYRSALAAVTLSAADVARLLDGVSSSSIEGPQPAGLLAEVAQLTHRHVSLALSCLQRVSQGLSDVVVMISCSVQFCACMLRTAAGCRSSVDQQVCSTLYNCQPD